MVKQSKQAPWLSTSRDGRTWGAQPGLNPAPPDFSSEPGSAAAFAIPSSIWFPCKALDEQIRAQHPSPTAIPNPERRCASFLSCSQGCLLPGAGVGRVQFVFNRVLFTAG